MEDHAKPIEEGRDVISDETDESEGESLDEGDEVDAVEPPAETALSEDEKRQAEAKLRREPLPMEQREITALLIRSNDDDGTGAVGSHLIDSINGGGFLEPSLRASMFRPIRVQVEPQAVNPIREVSYLFMNIVDPIRWVLLGLTILICIVSGISILVGIYNSMNQRRHEIAVLRALGARRSKVTHIMLAESVMLSLAGGLLGWIAGHVLNAALSPIVEARAGVRIGLFDFAPPVNWADYLSSGNSQILVNFLQYLSISPEFLLIPGMILLAILVGVYPAISAYRTDVAKSLGS
jgi:putative ABC transport system permease protein